MEHWQFLIQKQGDRTWQTLESPTLKILAGKYRVLARSHLANTDVEVRVTHSSIQEVLPKRRIFKRLRRTNTDGLMAVIPFIDLKPGIWELRCSGDLMTHMLGKSWQYTLTIKVLPLELSEQPKLGILDQELDGENLSGITPNENLDIQDVFTETEEDIIINQPVSPVWVKGETAEQILQSLIDLALPTSESLEEEQLSEDFRSISPLSPIKLSLERDSYIASWGKPITVNGDVELAETGNLEAEILSTPTLDQLQLVIELRSPLESKILTQVKQPLTAKTLPFKFSTAIDIPTECESKLILADMSLYGAITNGGEVILLGSSAFTITADVTELLTVRSKKSITPDLLTDSNQPSTQVEASKPEQPVSIGLELFNLGKKPKLAQFHILKPSPSKPLPPQIKPTVFLDRLSPQLPKLPRSQKDAIATNSVVADSLTPEGTVKIARKIAPINLDKLVIKQIKTALPYLKRLKTPAPEEVKSNTPDSLEPQISDESQPMVAIPSVEDATHRDTLNEAMPTAYPSGEASYAERLVGEASVYDTLRERIEESEAIAPEEENPLSSDESDVELSENAAAQVPTLDSEELITANTPDTSPLIKKWMQSQGYFLPEGMELVYEDDHTHESNEEQPLTLNEDNSAVEELNVDNTEENLYLDTGESLPEEEQTLPPSPLQSNNARLSQEIVLDDIYTPLTNDNNNQSPETQEQPLVDIFSPLLASLPTPQLFMPNGELLAGKSVKVRLELSEVWSGMAVKLWVEDYQTRGLLDGPHLLKDLRPTPWGNWEAVTQLVVPFGCVEIRVEAIALDLTTQQESRKVTLVKTVIPPDLPSMELDQLLGM
ncbi:hypothetical protein [Anabaena catenula]|uniref:Uncharacterized protein n=1 Tax=Anabaena catenula FACHB-362 TaxID=2692877 RepID=A0ABR8IZ65_9NOST|nr:hypothetical protein [Anabaena catenula]MBD2691341.1 hypothetical protein [Anabaena catenula FACHB-362]